MVRYFRCLVHLFKNIEKSVKGLNLLHLLFLFYIILWTTRQSRITITTRWNWNKLSLLFWQVCRSIYMYATLIIIHLSVIPVSLCLFFCTSALCVRIGNAYLRAYICIRLISIKWNHSLLRFYEWPNYHFFFVIQCKENE